MGRNGVVSGQRGGGQVEGQGKEVVDPGSNNRCPIPSPPQRPRAGSDVFKQEVIIFK